MELEFVAPSPALARAISVYYRIRLPYARIDDVERADVGYLRFFLSAKGPITFASGPQFHAEGPTLFGPSSETARYSLTGPLDCFGCVLLPEFWGSLVDIGADSCANRCIPANPVLGPECAAHFAALSGMDHIDDMAKATDAFLIRRYAPLPDDQMSVVERIGDWLRGYPIRPTQTLYDAIPEKSERQILRLANRHYGAPPKMLARKYRALRTASRLIGTRGAIPLELIGEYSDRAHMTRDVKHFTGLTPRQLQINSNPIVRATLHPDNFRADAPWT